MSGPEQALLEESAEELFEDAPCGYFTTDLDGRILRVNRTFEAWTGHSREQLVGARRAIDILGPGARIYYETHYLPLLLMQGWVREIAVEILRADGTLMPALVNAVLRRDGGGRPALIRTTVFDATDRRRYEEELRLARDRDRAVARRLQESLLEGVGADDPRLAVDVEYRPSGRDMQVGGDWYDVFPLDEERVVLVVGDVVGRGLDAAATMGQLRSAVRALASTGLGPAELLTALDAFTDRHRIGQMATVAYGVLDLGRASLRLACAGHMPPVIARPGEGASYVTEGRSAPLDAYLERAPRPETEVSFPPGTLLLLYTDGLVERGEGGLGERMDALLARAGALASDGAAAPARQIADSMLAERDAGDDVCVLAARRLGG